MEDDATQNTVRNRLLKQRLFIWCTAIPLLGVMAYLTVTYVEDWQRYPQLSYVARLPLLFPLLMQLSIFIWFVNRLLRVRSALKAERDGRDSIVVPSRPVISTADFYIVPAVYSLCFFVLAIVVAVFALKLPMQPDFESFRTNVMRGAVVLLAFSFVWPARVLLRKLRSGSFWLSEHEVQKRKMPKPLWRRILAACIWCAIAVGVTVETGEAPRTTTLWVVVFLFWFAAAVGTVDVFRFGIARPSWGAKPPESPTSSPAPSSPQPPGQSS